MASSVELFPAADMHVTPASVSSDIIGSSKAGRLDEVGCAYRAPRWCFRRPSHGTPFFSRNADLEPNLTPPVTTTDMALAYQERLQRLEPNVRFLMTLYLSPELTVEEVVKAKAAGIVGVKSYPKSAVFMVN